MEQVSGRSDILIFELVRTQVLIHITQIQN